MNPTLASGHGRSYYATPWLATKDEPVNRAAVPSSQAWFVKHFRR